MSLLKVKTMSLMRVGTISVECWDTFAESWDTIVVSWDNVFDESCDNNIDESNTLSWKFGKNILV